MANTKQAKKAQRQAITRNASNKSEQNRIKTLLRTFKKDLESSDQEQIQKSASSYVSSLDKAVKHHTIHKNEASRKKSAVAVAVAKRQNT